MNSANDIVTIIGGGLAGAECAWQLARRGHAVRLHEMRPGVKTAAHQTGLLAELVCSNSFRSDNPLNAIGLLKREMAALDSLIIRCGRAASVPAGDALAVDRVVFATGVTTALEELSKHGRLEIIREEMSRIPATGTVVIATGPLTSPALEGELRDLLGEEYLYFYDSMAPILTSDSLDWDKLYRASRYGKGGGDDYVNAAMNRTEYEAFIAALLAAEKTPIKDFELGIYFEGCLPIEVMAERGLDTLRFGPMKPVGLPHPKTGAIAHAVVQLRQDDLARDDYNIVGFQTKLRIPEQRRVFRMIPGFENAEFVRYGMLHRNTYINSPAHLDRRLRLKRDPRIAFAGQLTGVEGYVESAATGLCVGLYEALAREGSAAEPFPYTTALGALARHLTERPVKDFQPANISFGIIDDTGIQARRKEDRRRAIVGRALAQVDTWRAQYLGDVPAVAPQELAAP